LSTFAAEDALTRALATVQHLPPRSGGKRVRLTDPGTSAQAATKVSTAKRIAQAERCVRALWFSGRPSTRDDVAEIVIAAMGHAGSKRLWRSEMRISSDLVGLGILVVTGREDGRELIWFPGDPMHPKVEPRRDEGEDAELFDWPESEIPAEWGDGE
jgi:hypothetical protein